MAHILTAPTRLPDVLLKDKSLKKVFLAGSIEMGKAIPWQDRVAEEVSAKKLILLNPRRADWDSSWTQDPTPGTQFHEQVTWEQDYLSLADIVVFFFDPKTQSPITLLELGHALGSGKKIIVCCPDGYFRKGNVIIVCKRHGYKVLNEIEELIKEIKKL